MRDEGCGCKAGRAKGDGKGLVLVWHLLALVSLSCLL
jgi:hypothetical protein